MPKITINRPLKPTKKRKKKIDLQNTAPVSTRGGVKSRRLSKREKARRKTARTYERLYTKLDLYAQAPLRHIEKPQSRDVKRLESRLETVHKYDVIYRRYERSVKGFNEKYFQDVRMPSPHDKINKKTLAALERGYEAWKKWRRNFVRKIPKEDETVLDNFFDLLDEVSTSQRFDKPSEQRRAEIRAISLYNLMNEVLLELKKGSQERKRFIRHLRNIWDELKVQIDKYLYDSMTPDQRSEVWNIIVFLVTGDGMKETEIRDNAIEDKTY